MDEEVALYCIVQLENKKIVTKYMSEINFMSAPVQGDVVKIGMEVIKFGKSSLTLKSEVRNMMTRQTVLTVDNIVMVNLGKDGKPSSHGKTEVEFVKNRLS